MSDPSIFTSSSVTGGHPDKLCDRISDAVVDAYLTADPGAAVIAESAVASGILFLAVRATGGRSVDITRTARRVIREAGYIGGDFDAERCTITTSFAGNAEAPPDGETISDDIVSQQQVTVFGYATAETANVMPAPIALAHRLARALNDARQSGRLPELAPDGQAQVSVAYQDGRPVRLHAVTIQTAVKADSNIGLDALRDGVIAEVIARELEGEPLGPDGETRILVNPTGLVIGGGPGLHAGLTGRKTAIDTYGEIARHGGAALSGKDPGRVDRTGAYAARYAAKNAVSAGLAERCEVTLSYDIGLAAPISFQVESFGTGKVPDAEIAERLAAAIDFRPGAIMRHFGLARLPAKRDGRFYEDLAVYGHMGRDDLDAPWEVCDLKERLT
jgi:S-adenosylmethionine synthetase